MYCDKGRHYCNRECMAIMYEKANVRCEKRTDRTFSLFDY